MLLYKNRISNEREREREREKERERERWCDQRCVYFSINIDYLQKMKSNHSIRQFAEVI